ncbi:hypothetical protein CELL_01687 [Cellulomonas sp. T2.31MG-18]|uniref:hypothetical protein n=1 Tax=Cellulomonas sp. T2.31MG-18 TaxID=3157619 RepID=UPI0035EA2AC3
MPNQAADRPFFIPAESEAEAIERIYALTGRKPQRGPGGRRAGKGALTALRDALELDIDIVRTPAATAERIAEALDVEWYPSRFTNLNMVNLNGLNALLEGATDAYRGGSLRRLRADIPSALEGPEWESFEPARSKIEAVTRIARLTNAPVEWLGPGAKEHKSVFLNLADNLFPGDPRIDQRTKTNLGASLAAVLGVPWTDACASTGETIQLVGLNTVLAGAERHLGLLGTSAAKLLLTAEDEGHALAAALHAGFSPKKRGQPHWDGRDAVQWMVDESLPSRFQTEWQGWFYEARGRSILQNAFPPAPVAPRVAYGPNTTFDYALNHVWDLKAHTERWLTPSTGALSPIENETILNDEQAVRECIEDQGLGFLVINGIATEDEDGSFRAWHRALRVSGGRNLRESENSTHHRRMKAGFRAISVEAFWIPNTPALLAAIAAGSMQVAVQGRQASGAARRNKFKMRPRQARADSGIRVASFEWPTA